jgi:hypothetical protein
MSAAMSASGRYQPLVSLSSKLSEWPLLVKADIAAKYIPELTAADCMRR